MRIHDLPVAKAAIWVGVGVGVSQAVGSLCVGPFADRFSKGEPARLVLIPMLGTAGALVAGLIMSVSPSFSVMIAALVAVGFLAGIFVATGYSLILSLAAPDLRGTTLAAGKLISVLIGGGLIPFLTGFVSDMVGGEESLRTAMIFTVLLYGVATLFFFNAARCIRCETKNAQL